MNLWLLILGYSFKRGRYGGGAPVRRGSEQRSVSEGETSPFDYLLFPIYYSMITR